MNNAVVCARGKFGVRPQPQLEAIHPSSHPCGCLDTLHKQNHPASGLGEARGLAEATPDAIFDASLDRGGGNAVSCGVGQGMFRIRKVSHDLNLPGGRLHVPLGEQRKGRRVFTAFTTRQIESDGERVDVYLKHWSQYGPQLYSRSGGARKVALGGESFRENQDRSCASKNLAGAALHVGITSMWGAKERGPTNGCFHGVTLPRARPGTDLCPKPGNQSRGGTERVAGARGRCERPQSADDANSLSHHFKSGQWKTPRTPSPHTLLLEKGVLDKRLRPLFRKESLWLLRYYDSEFTVDGSVRRVQKTKKLAVFGVECPNRTAARDLAGNFLKSINLAKENP